MRKLMVSLLLLVGFMMCAGAGLARDGNIETAVIDGKTADRVHLREQPSAQSKSLGLYFTGTEVRYEAGTGGEWVWVNIGSEAGYIKSEYLKLGASRDSVLSRQPIGKISTQTGDGWVNLRSEPSQQAAITGKYSHGDAVMILGETTAHWFYVRVGDQYGYMMSDYVTVGSFAASGQSGTTSSPSAVSPSGTAAFGAYKAVLLGNATFVNAYDNQTMDIRKLGSLVEGVSMETAQFAVADLDGDGIPEVVLLETVGGTEYGFVVLHYQDGTVYGYDFVYRALMQLKTDGTFSFSSGAMDYGFGTMTFTKNTGVINDMAYCQSGNGAGSNNVSYFIGQKQVTADAFHSAVAQQDRKPDAVWYDFTVKQIEAMLR